MTTKEQQTIDNLFKAVQDLRTENSKFREDVKLQVEAINTKTEKMSIFLLINTTILIGNHKISFFYLLFSLLL